MPHRAPRRRTRPDTGPRGPGTAQRICSSQLRGRSSSHRAGALAVLPRTMSSSWPRPTSTMLVAQALARNRPRRHVRVSSSPSAKTSEIRSVSASSSASPQRRTDVFTGCQLHPSSEATSWTGRPQPAWRVAQRPARAVSRSRTGAIAGSCSVTVPAGHPRRLQRHRRLCHACLTVGRPNAGRSTNSTARSPSDHNAPPHPPQPGLGAWEPAGGCGLAAARRLRLRRRAPPRRPVPPTAHTRVGSDSTGILQILGCLGGADSGGSLTFSRGPSRSSLRPQTRRARFLGPGRADSNQGPTSAAISLMVNRHSRHPRFC